MALRATRAALLSRARPPTINPATLQQTSTKTGKSTTMTTILEVERKFRRLTVPTLTDIHLHLHRNNHNHNHNHNHAHLHHPDPPRSARKPTPTSSASSELRLNMFTSVYPLPTTAIHDIYYDTPQQSLCAAGAWVRRRNGEWEAKVRPRGARGDFVNSRFEELRGEGGVGACVMSVLGPAWVKESYRAVGGGDAAGGGAGVGMNFGLGKLAEFVTTREAWVVDGEFTVVRDRMDFGHEVGEVELQVEVEVDGEGAAAEKEKAALMEEMDGRIESFMKRYEWAWERGEAVGKMTAYFEMMKKSGGRM